MEQEGSLADSIKFWTSWQIGEDGKWQYDEKPNENTLKKQATDKQLKRLQAKRRRHIYTQNFKNWFGGLGE